MEKKKELIPLNNKFEILKLVGAEGELKKIKQYDKGDNIIIQYEKNGYIFSIMI